MFVTLQFIYTHIQLYLTPRHGTTISSSSSNTVAINHVLFLSRVPWKSEWKFPKSELTHNHQHNSPFRPSLVNSFPFPCHSVLPSSSRRSQRISRPSISIAVVPPINKISLWPWEPTPLYLQLQRHFLPIWHWNLNRIHLLIVICRKQSSLHCLFVL